MKIAKLEIVGFDDKDRRKALYELAKSVQVATNCIWREWIVWHTVAKTAGTIRAELEADRRWRETKQGERPKQTTNAWPAEFGKRVNEAVADRVPELHSRCRTLLLQSTRGKVITRKSAEMAIKGWKAILLDRESVPSCTRPQPIPFDKANSEIVREGDGLTLVVRVDRYLDESGRGKSEPWRFALKVKGKVRRYAQPMFDAADGVASFAGSSLFYDARKKKWFALLAYQEAKPEAAAVDPDRVLYLRAGAKNPWRVRVDGRSWAIVRDADFIAHRRSRVLLSRLGRQHNYRWASRSSKGHGTRRAVSSAHKMAQGWRMFAKSVNESVAFQAVQLAVEKGCASIVVLGHDRSDRALATAGKLPEFNDSSAWPFFEFLALLKMKAGRKVISVETRRSKVESASAVASDQV